MTRAQLILLATAGSAALLLGAWTFQYFGVAPCKMCIWQRYPHGAAVIIGALALLLPWVLLPWLGALALAVTGGIAIYHSGVERGIFEGPTSCTSGSIGDMSTDDLFNQIMAAPLVRCDEIAWQMLGVTMPNLNAILSLALMLIWLLAARRRA